MERETPTSTITFVFGIGSSSLFASFPGALAGACDRHANRLNEVTRSIVAARLRFRYLEPELRSEYRPADAEGYESWSNDIARRIAAVLGDGQERNLRDQRQSELKRQAALEAMQILDLPPDPVLDEITARARSIFHTDFARIALIDGPRETVISASGISAWDSARQESICAVTIQRDEHLAVEDTLLHARYANFRSVSSGPKVRSYAGYPIESADGHRVGTLCVFDSRPRRFSDADATQLRMLAQEAQRRLGVLSQAAAVAAKAAARSAGELIERYASPEHANRRKATASMRRRT